MRMMEGWDVISIVGELLLRPPHVMQTSAPFSKRCSHFHMNTYEAKKNERRS